MNGLLLLPVVLSLVGPDMEVKPKDGADRLDTPTPPRMLTPQFHREPDNYNRNNNLGVRAPRFRWALALFVCGDA